RLSDRAVKSWNLRVMGRERPCRALAMDPDPLALAADGVLLELGDVVADVINQVHLQLLPRAAEDFREDLAGLMRQALPVAPGKVGRRTHGRDIALTLRTVDRTARQLAIGQRNVIPFGCL